MAKKNEKLTKQGVRDLNSLPSKPKGKILEEPPVAVLCKHLHTRESMMGYMVVCSDCGAEWDTFKWAHQ